MNTNADFTIRHNAGFAPWLKAARKAHRGKKVLSHCTIGGMDKKPDGCIENAHSTGNHKYLEYKLLSPLGSDGTPTNKYAAQAAHAGVAPILDEIQDKYGGCLKAGNRSHSLTRILTDTFGGVHIEGVKFLKDSGAHLRGLDQPGHDPTAPLDEPRSDDEDSPAKTTASPYYSQSMQSISLAAHVALAEHVFRVIRSARE